MEFSNDKLDHQCFFDDNFNVDSYLSTHMQKCDLSTLRKELKKHGTQLYNETINILKTETKSIVHFAENLSLLSSKVTNLSQPVLQFREEIRNLHGIITTMQENYQYISRSLQCSDREQNLINLKMGIISSVAYIKCIIYYTGISKEDLITLEWIINEYSYQMIYLKKLGLHQSDFDIYVMEIENRLKEYLNHIFLKTFQEKDEKMLLRCLRLYVSLAKQSEAEKVIREQVVQPALKNIFSQENFNRHSQDLNKLHSQALYFLHKEITILYSLINQNSEITGFNFTFNSFWTEVDRELVEGLSNVAAPGNPQLFQERFRDSWNFLLEIIKYDTDSEKNKNHYFQAHIKRFNLPVYFEIRYQQIGVRLEENLLVDPTNNDIFEESSHSSRKIFNLKPTNAFWDCLNLCFVEDVFLEHLSDQFIRLSMLLLSRFLKWLGNVVESETYDKDKLEVFFVNMLSDLIKLQLEIGSSCNNEIQITVYKILPAKLRPLIIKILKTNGIKIQHVQNVIRTKLIHQRTQTASLHLQQVTSIPRIYRRTNRSVPKEPSSYVVELINDLKDFHSRHSAVINTIEDNILDCIIKEVTEKYITLIRDVLNSVSKTEKSLRRLKNRSLNSTEEVFNAGTVESMSDESKIKVQIKLDVDYYVKQVRDFSIVQSAAVVQNIYEQVNF